MSEIEQLALEFANKVIALHNTPKEPVSQEKPAVTPQAVKYGDVNEAVEHVQRRLNELGYLLTVDGKFFAETKKRALEFQRANWLDIDGGFNATTDWEALFSPDAVRKPVIEAGEIGKKIAEIAEQEALKKLQWRPQGMNSEAEKYLATVRRAIGMPSGRFAWCGAFVTWCTLEAGWSIPIVYKTGHTSAYVPAIETWARSEGIYYSSRDIEFNPEPGDWLIFDWNSDASPDHVGIVLEYDREKNPFYVKTAEGNTSASNDSNGDSTAIRSRHWNTIRGFIRVSQYGVV